MDLLVTQLPLSLERNASCWMWDAKKRDFKSSHNCGIREMKTRVFGLCSTVRQKSFGDCGAQKSCFCARACLWTLQWDCMVLLSLSFFFFFFTRPQRSFLPIFTSWLNAAVLWERTSLCFCFVFFTSWSVTVAPPYMDFTEADHPNRLMPTQDDEKEIHSTHKLKKLLYRKASVFYIVLYERKTMTVFDSHLCSCFFFFQNDIAMSLQWTTVWCDSLHERAAID